jgi:uncharacterized protein (TIGR00369 family)
LKEQILNQSQSSVITHIVIGGVQLPALNPEHLKAVMDAINGCPFFKHMSIEVTEMGKGYSVVTAEIQKKHMNPFGGLHGGAYSSVIDTAAYWAAYCDLPEENGLVSIDLKVDFLAPVNDGKVIVKGQSIKSGKTLHLAEAKMLDGGGKLLAFGTSKLMVTPRQQSIDDVTDYLGSGKLPKKFIEE